MIYVTFNAQRPVLFQEAFVTIPASGLTWIADWKWLGQAEPSGSGKGSSSKM